MTKHLIILHIPDRLAQPHRPKPLVRSDPGGRAKGASRQRPRPILAQTRLPNAETATFNLKKYASTAVTRSTESTLSP